MKRERIIGKVLLRGELALSLAGGVLKISRLAAPAEAVAAEDAPAEAVSPSTPAASEIPANTELS